jgi:hypothetical protein
MSRAVYAFSRDHGKVHVILDVIICLDHSQKLFPMEATSERTRNLRIHLFAPSGLRQLSVFFPGYWILSAQLLPMLFSPSRLWRWTWVILFRSFAEGFTTVTRMLCLNLVHTTWVMDGWVCCAILFAYHGHSSFASSSQYRPIFQ